MTADGDPKLLAIRKLYAAGEALLEAQTALVSAGMADVVALQECRINIRVMLVEMAFQGEGRVE